jgi:hypothetical protein
METEVLQCKMQLTLDVRKLSLEFIHQDTKVDKLIIAYKPSRLFRFHMLVFIPSLKWSCWHICKYKNPSWSEEASRCKVYVCCNNEPYDSLRLLALLH